MAQPPIRQGQTKVPRKNKIINGNFDFWQRGTSFTVTSGTYGADRWRHTGAFGTQGTLNITREEFTPGQTDVPNEPKYYMRWDQTGAPSAEHGYEQRIEGVRTLAGKTVTLSFWSRVPSGTFTPNISLFQYTGTGGSPFPNSITVSPSLVIPSSWTKFEFTINLPSLSGFSIGPNNDDYLTVFFQTPASGTWTWDLAQVQFEEGPVATEFEERDDGEEFALCQRYYEKSYPLEQTPGTVGGIPEILARLSPVIPHFAGVEPNNITFSQPKRLPPSITILATHLINTVGVNIYSEVFPGGGTLGGVGLNIGPRYQGFQFFIDTATWLLDPGLFQYCLYHWTADAEL